MRRRRYRLGRRAEAAAATERRIVEATLTLHDEQGISSTSVRDVARRAQVAPSTVLNHFPVMDDLIRACGELSEHLAPMPTDTVLAGASGPAERVRRMAAAMFQWWDRMGRGFDHLRRDRMRIPEVDAWMADVEQRHRHLAAAALEGVADLGAVDMLVAMTTADAWTALRSAGTDASSAAARISILLVREAPIRKEAVH